MGIIIVLGVVSLIIGLIIACATDSEGIAVLVTFLGIIIGFAIASSNPIVTLDEDIARNLIVVNVSHQS